MFCTLKYAPVWPLLALMVTRETSPVGDILCRDKSSSITRRLARVDDVVWPVRECVLERNRWG